MTRSAVEIDALTVARAAAGSVPASVPLTAVPARDRPAGAALAVVASFVGRPSAALALVAESVVADLTAAGLSAGTPIELADALRPALDAAAAALGTGVLESVRTETAEHAMSDDMDVFALQAGGATLGWFGLRIRGTQVPEPTVSVVPTQRTSMRVLYDVEMALTVELGRTRLPLREVLDLAPGAVLELDRGAGAPADLLVNGRLIARGEVVVVDENYGVRITQIVSGAELHG